MQFGQRLASLDSGAGFAQGCQMQIVQNEIGLPPADAMRDDLWYAQRRTIGQSAQPVCFSREQFMALCTIELDEPAVTFPMQYQRA